MDEAMILTLYRRLADDARARAVSAPTDHIRRGYLDLLAHYEARKAQPATVGSLH